MRSVLPDYYGSEISTTNIANNHANYKNSSFAPPTIDFAWADQRDRASELGAVRRRGYETEAHQLRLRYASQDEA